MRGVGKAAASLAGLVALVACGQADETSTQTTDVAFSNRVVVPARGRAMLVSLRLANRGAKPVVVTGVTAPRGPSLLVEYLGYADCSHGCPGGEIDNEDAYRDVVRSKLGTYGFSIPPESDASAVPVYLMFRATARGALPPKDGCLAAGAAELRLGSGETVHVSFKNSWTMGLVGLDLNRNACHT